MSSALCGCFPILQAPKQKKQLLESKYLLQKSLENYVKLNIIEKNDEMINISLGTLKEQECMPFTVCI